MSNHTPCPWEIRKGDPTTENHVANVRGLDIYGPYKAVACIDDARLVSASPDLLDAIRNLMSLAAPFHRDTDPVWAACRDQVNAAIAKATGQSS